MTNKQEKNLKICLISFSDVKTDGRTANIIEQCCRFGFDVAVISLSVISMQDNKYRHFRINVNQSERMIKSWWHFTTLAKKTNIKADIYFACDLYSLPAASKFAKQQNAKLIYDSREIYSALGSLHNRPFSQLVITQIEKRYIKNVDKMVVSGDEDAKLLKLHFHHSLEYTTILNLPYYEKPEPQNILRDNIGIALDRKIIIYQGAIFKGRGIGLVIDALALLDSYEFCILGDGPDFEYYKSLAKSKGYSNRVHFLGSIPYNELHRYTSSADIGVSIFEPISESYRLALPNKLFEYIRAGIPSVATNLVQIKAVNDKYNITELVEPNATIEQIAIAIQKASKNKSDDKYVKAIHKAAKELSYETQTAKINSLFTDW